MNKTTRATLALSILAVAGCCSSSSRISSHQNPPVAVARTYPANPMPKPADGEIVVKLSPSWVKRMGAMRISASKNGGLPDMEEPQPEKLVRGEVTVGAENVILYLPAVGPYAVSSADQDSFRNTSTAISVDANRDGKLDESERWFSSMPVRIGDQMFDVKQIDPGGTWITFGKSSAKLAGFVVGKPCPDFRFFTTDGNRVAPADYKGKALLLDIWSMT